MSFSGDNITADLSNSQEMGSDVGYEEKDLKAMHRERMLDDPRFALEVAAHEAAHAFWGFRLGLDIEGIGLNPPGVDFTIDPLDGLQNIRSTYTRNLKKNIATRMESWLGYIPPLEKLMGMGDATFFDLLGALKPDYQTNSFSLYRPVCATPISRIIGFPEMQMHEQKAHIFGQAITLGRKPKPIQMKRILWQDDNPLHREPDPLSLAVMAATVPVMGPFMGKTWATLYHLSPEEEPGSFSEWLCLEAPTDNHYLHAYQDHGKTRFFWHTTIHMAENCGGGGDYMNMLWSDQSRRAIGARISVEGASPDTVMGAEALSGASFQDVVLAVFLSPLMYLHQRKAKIMYAVNGLARKLLSTKDMHMSGAAADKVLTEFLKRYDREAVSTQKSLDFFMAERWANLYSKYIDQHLSTILHEQFKDGSKRFFRAVDYFNDPKWTPVVAETTYNKFKHENWFTWTDQPFKSGRLTTGKASPLL